MKPIGERAGVPPIKTALTLVDMLKVAPFHSTRNQMRRCLVTGCAGFIGSHVVDSLLACGAEVSGIDSFDPFYPREVKLRNISSFLSHPRFRFLEGDILDATQIESLLTPDTIVVHLAAKAGVRPSIRDPRGYARTNVEGTASVAEAMRATGATRLVFASSSSVYGNSTAPPFCEDATALEPVSPYAATKRAAELVLVSLAPLAGLRVAALRFFTVFGPRQRPDLAIHAFARRMLLNEPLTLYGDGSQARDYTYCDDIVAGTIAAAAWTSTAPVGVEFFNLGGNHPISLATMVATLAGALKVTPQVVWQPMQPGDVERTCADITKSGTVLGYAPKVPFDVGIKRFADWCRCEYAQTR